MSKNKSVSQPSSNLESLRNLTVLTATAMLVASGAGVEAQATSTNTPPASGTVTKLPEEVVKGEAEKPTLSSPKYTEPLRDIPQTITVIPRAIIEEQGATSLRDILRNVSGISMQAGEGGTPAGDQMTIRGASARTDIFIDGVRDFGGYSRDPFNLEQVEVAKGPSSSYSGRGSTGGSINLVSKSPKLDPAYGGSLGMGTDSYKRMTLDVNQPLGEIGLDTASLRLNGMWHESDIPGRDVADESRWGVAPSVAFGLGTPTTLTLGYFHMEQDNTPDYGIPWVPANTGPLAAYSDKPAPVDYSNFYGLKARDYEEIQSDLVTAEVKHQFNESVELRNITRYGLTDRDSIITAPRFVDANTSTAIRRNDWKSRDQEDEIWANQTDVRFDFETGPVEHSLVTGIDLSREEDLNKTRVATGPNSPTTDLYNPNPNDPYTEAIAHNGAYTKATAESAAFYVVDTIKLTEQWQINGGLRGDYFSTDYKSVSAAGVATEIERIDRMLSWRGGLVYKPLPYGSIYFGYGTSFNPSAEGLSLGTTATAANSLSVDPEENESYEIGTKWDFMKDRLSLSMAFFRTDKTNARTEDPTNPADVIVLDGMQRIQGVELGASGLLTEEWRVTGTYTYMDSEIRRSRNAAEVGNEISNTPEHSFGLWTTYEFPIDLDLGFGAQFVGDRFSSNANTRTAPSYLIFDAMAAYHFTKNFTLRLNVYNLTDKDYIDRVGGGHFMPGWGRSAVLSASLSF